MRLGLDKGAHELPKNEFEIFVKSDDSALESLELSNSLLVLASKFDSVLTNKNEFLLVVYVSPTKKKVFRKVYS